MRTDYYTTVAITPNFWEHFISKSINEQLFSDGEAKFLITSNQNLDIEKVKNLSRKYPDEVFDVKIYAHEFCSDLISEYRIKNGRSVGINSMPIYDFNYSDEVANFVSLDVINDFKKEIVELLNRLQDHELIGIQYQTGNLRKKKIISNIELKYSNNNYVLSATVTGRYHIKIELISFIPDEDNPF
jgi:hypothetical protein